MLGRVVHYRVWWQRVEEVGPYDRRPRACIRQGLPHPTRSGVEAVFCAAMRTTLCHANVSEVGTHCTLGREARISHMLIAELDRHSRRSGHSARRARGEAKPLCHTLRLLGMLTATE